MLQYFEKISPLVESLGYTLQGEIYIIGCYAAGDLLRQYGRHLEFHKNGEFDRKRRKLKILLDIKNVT